MKLKDKKIGYVLTGSFCTFSKTIPVIKELVKNEAKVIPIMSYNSYNFDTKFGKAQDFISEIEKKIINASKLLGKILKPRRKLNVIIPATFNKLQAK